MKGLELCRRYYYEIGRPVFAEQFPEVMARCAAGLAGDGSECLGYDDELSRDHDFGPGFCLWLTEADCEKYGREMQRTYDALPREFLGFRRQESAGGGGRVGVMEIHSFYSRFIGSEQPPKDLLRWLYLPEDRLCQVTSGEVFEDPQGEFSAIRKALQAYYPEDVRIKKIAACAVRMAQSGQYNYGRTLRRGDSVAAGLALQEFVSSALHMIWLLNRRYAPYYKWRWHGLNELRSAGELSVIPDAVPLLQELSVTGDRKQPLIEELCAMTADRFRAEGLSTCGDDFLEPHAREVMRHIRDSRLAACHILEG